jgi:YidC/Oxa1 family membrane protein insertase
MNKTDRIIVALLFCLLIGWSFYGRKLAPKPVPVETPPAAEAPDVPEAAGTAAPAEATVAAPAKPVVTEPEETVVHAQPEQTVVLGNDLVKLAFSSWGGGITSVELSEYPATMEKDSGPVVLDFAQRPALGLAGLPGLSSADDFEVTHLSGVNGVAIKRQNASGLSLSRVAVLTNEYVLVVTDTIRNESDEPFAVPESQMSTGPMANIKTKASTRGISYLGADVLSTTEDKVLYKGKKLTGLFGVRGGCSKPDLTGAPLTQTLELAEPLGWVAVKNKFFAQVLIPSEGGSRCSILAGRDDDDTRFTLSQVSAGVSFPERVLQPGESYEQVITYYVGPKKFSKLKALGNKQGHIMLRAWPWFGWWRSACIGLLWLLNALYFVTRNYGIAVILLTIIVKIVFWPLTHKGTENMKRMQKLQPQLTKLREKFKDNPKKLQEKQMLLYRENGVNPLAGCLPMFVQMPVFIALFTVLRSAVELRFAPFLWIADLSEPEGLLAGVLPFPAGGLNLLPLAMTGTMILQQRLTPTAGDPQQQKMMQFMPLMMLFIFYNMSSALVLYWTVSQVLSIVQLVMQQRKEKAES